MKQNKNNFKSFLNINLIIGFTSLVIAIINAIFIKNKIIAGIIFGVNFMIIIYDLIILKYLKKEEKELLNELGFRGLGFRKDFNWETRLHLITRINGYKISTIDLGIDHSFGVGEPLYYKTMIFDKYGNELDGFQARYSTEQQARKGHKKAIEYVKSLGEDNDNQK